MFSKLYNQARLMYRLEPVSGLLVRSGREPADPTRPDMEFIRTWVEVAGDLREVPFLPGSSVKGVVRSHAERVLRTLGLHCCDPTGDSCGRNEEVKGYKEHCYACRTFGSTKLAARMRFSDALPWAPHASDEERKQGAAALTVEVRPGNVVDRRRGSSKNFFEMEVLTAGAFYGEITVRNYQLWQLGLLAVVLRDINEGFQRVGGLKSRGLGRVKLIVEDLRLEQHGPLATDERTLRGIGALGELVEEYDLIGQDYVALPAELEGEIQEGLRSAFRPANGRTAEAAWRAVATAIMKGEHWRIFIDARKRG